ncbi:sulfatase-like hydrolase/transferase [Streptomyces acidicola]|uniref:sulfatase-like hydrolase/transferase n=1 Tax=Streptomyces acidicola TaxID=2596892 RepID=UPI0037F43891
MTTDPTTATQAETPQAEPPRDERPNFVIIVPDQLRADALGRFGNDRASTPHLDALADRGTVFEQAYVQHPVCSPSRASFLTGWYPHVRGHRTLTHLLQAEEPNLLRILKDAGYHVTWAGTRGDTFAPGVTELSAHEYGHAEPPTRRQFVKDYPDDTWARAFYRGRLEPDGLTDHDEAAVRTAERRLAEPPDRPWVLFVPLFAPHCPFQAEEPWYSMHDRDRVPEPLPVPGGPDAGHEPGFKEAIRRTYGLDRLTPEMWREVAAVYHGMVSRLDHHVGRVQDAVAASGQAERTVTLFFADHGEYLGDFGLIEKWPSAMDACITRDPLVISGGGLPAGQRYEGMVELIDVLPTVLELAGVEAPHRHYGRSLLPVLRDPEREHRQYAFTEGGFVVEEEPQMERPAFPYDLKGDIQHDRPELVGKAVAVRDREWTYVWRLYEPPELYHRATDPGESVNLAGRPEHADVERRMADALLRWQVETADVIPAAHDPRFPPVELPAPAVPGTGPA